MRIKFIIVIWACLCLSACSNLYEQHYNEYTDYNKINARPKSWFPENIIFEDAYNLRSVSCLDSLSAFGEFNYSKHLLYDSVFNSKDIIHIPLNVYIEKIKYNQQNMPKWFHVAGNNLSGLPETILIDRFYISRDKVNKRISFVLCD